jgi:hypothetical protein
VYPGKSLLAQASCSTDLTRTKTDTLMRVKPPTGRPHRMQPPR